MTMWEQAWDVIKFVAPIIFALFLFVLKMRSDLDTEKAAGARRDERINKVETHFEERLKSVEALNSNTANQINQMLVMLARLEERIERFIMSRD